MTLREQIKTLVTTIAGDIKAAAGGSTESLNAAVSTKVTEVVGTGDDNEFVTLYTTTRDAK